LRLRAAIALQMLDRAALAHGLLNSPWAKLELRVGNAAT
jgi:hypothetical protein